MIAQLQILQTYYLLLNDTERISIDFRKTNTKLFTTTSQEEKLSQWANWNSENKQADFLKRWKTR